MGLRLAAIIAALVLAPCAAAKEKPPQWKQDVETASKGLATAEADGRLTAEEAARYQAALTDASQAAVSLYPGRAAIVHALLGDVARAAKVYNPTRALTLFAMLETNVAYLRTHAIPPGGRDIVGADGVVYRMFNGAGLQFHPLANGAKLNALLAGNKDDQALALAESLLTRAGPNGLYEYWFRFHNAAPPWTSGMAQAVLAQALARAGQKFADPRFTEAAQRAYAPVPATLVMRRAEGPWVHLYSGLELVVLNAQLQAALSVRDYATLTADPAADAFAAELRAAATALLPKFDTGAWSRYSLGEESTLEYQRFVVSLLKRLATTTGEQHWRDWADRFERYELEPPLVNLGTAPAPIYPEPRDGHRDVAEFKVWVSKAGTAEADGRRTSVRRGWNTVTWQPPASAAPGLHEVTLVVTDHAGNETLVDAPPVEIRRDAERPVVQTARLRNRVLSWRVVDEGTARVRLVLAPAARRPLDLGWQTLRGAKRLPRTAPPASTLRIMDAAGNGTTVRLAR